jgi:hypothetical protein
MRKVYLLAAVAATVLASCSSNEKLDTSPVSQQPDVSTAAEIPVGFSVYTSRPTSTRSGLAGEINTTVLGTVDNPGFGVFGYYTDNNDYDPQCAPNFFYNQRVYAKAVANTFEYEPVKFWPNEYGNNAISDDNDKVSFFAYAPYVDVTPSTGKVVKANPTDDNDKWGITGMSRNSSTGDPLIKYIASFDEDKSVDLLWGTVGVSNTLWPVVNDPSTAQNMTPGLPWLNVQRPSQIDQKLTFDFRHALSQLSVDVDAFIDGTDATKPLPTDGKTRIFIRSVSFSGFAMKGALNLNNTAANTALWLDYSGTADLDNGETVVIYDGRKDGKEGATGSEASNEKTLGLNPQFVQDENSIATGAWAATGVTNTAAPLFRKWNGAAYVASTSPIMVIPTGDKLEVEIVYDVETLDPNLANYVSDAKTPGSSIENRIRKEVVFGSLQKMESGKRYVIHLHLGMNSVKLDAVVEPWKDAESSAHVDLPLNVPAFAAAATPTPQTVNLLATQTKYELAITGLNGGESVTSFGTAGNITAATSAAANSSGVAIQSVTITANDKVTDIAAVPITWTGNASAKAVVINFVQKAHALALGYTAVADGDVDIVLTSGAAGIDWTTDVATPATDIIVKKNGTVLTYNASAPGAGEFTWNAANNKLTLPTTEAATTGDVFEITVTAGDAPAETISVTIP